MSPESVCELSAQTPHRSFIISFWKCPFWVHVSLNTNKWLLPAPFSRIELCLYSSYLRYSAKNICLVLIIMSMKVLFWRFSTAWYGTVRFSTAHFWGGFHWVQYLVPGTFFSTTSVEVPSEPYRYQNVTCKLCWSLIGRRKSSLPASLNLQHETQQTH